MEAYCMKCRKKKEIKGPEEWTMKNGQPAVKGICPECGTKMNKVIKKEETRV